jgi:hypothetical protein
MKFRSTVKWKFHIRSNVGVFKGVTVEIITYAKIQVVVSCIKIITNFGRKLDLSLP